MYFNKNINKLLSNYLAMRKKVGANKGQVYIIAAVLIVGTIITFATIMNYSKKQNPIEIYNIGEELGTESVNVLEYGTYNNYDNEQMKRLLISFIKEYSRYGNIERLYFIFGNLSGITFVGYHELIVDRIYITSGTNISEIVIPDSAGAHLVVKDLIPQNENITIGVTQTDYNFRLRAGENFYFIIFQKEGEEQHVIQGGNRLDG